MKRENLRKILESETSVDVKIDKILDSYHSEIEPIKNELTLEKEAKQSVEQELKTANETISNLEKNTEDSEQIAKEIESYKNQIQELTIARDNEKISNAIELAIVQAKGRNSKAIRALLDSDKIKLESDGTVSGIDEQLKQLSKSEAYLFESEPKAPVQKSTGYDGPKGSQAETKEAGKSLIDKFVKNQNEKNKSIAPKPLFSEQV